MILKKRTGLRLIIMPQSFDMVIPFHLRVMGSGTLSYQAIVSCHQS